MYRIVLNQKPQRKNPSWRPIANAAGLNATTADGWLMDSGATHHVTSDLQNFAIHNPYTGNDSIVVGNGAVLPITHTGSFSTNSATRKFQFNNVLYVPSIHKNLISVYQFCNDNQTSVELFLSMFQMKALDTGASLLTDPAKGGSYEWPCSSSLGAFSVLKSSLSNWHHRLGHPDFPILKPLLLRFYLLLYLTLWSPLLAILV